MDTEDSPVSTDKLILGFSPGKPSTNATDPNGKKGNGRKKEKGIKDAVRLRFEVQCQHRWIHSRVEIEGLTLLQFRSKALQAVISANIPAPCGRTIRLSNTGRFFYIQMVTAWQPT